MGSERRIHYANDEEANRFETPRVTRQFSASSQRFIHTPPISPGLDPARALPIQFRTA